jgi:murein DD-endopeptidase MepM/ murein hydrolase activator NlpD
MRYILGVSLLLLSACSQQQVAELIDRRGNVYARNGWFSGGQPVARYSPDNPASQPQDIAYKYQDTSAPYGVDAPVDKVTVRNLEAPEARNSNDVMTASLSQGSGDTAISASTSSTEKTPFAKAVTPPEPAVQSTTTAAPASPALVQEPASLKPSSGGQMARVSAPDSSRVSAPVGGANVAFRWPVDGKVISRFGPKTDGMANDGINIAATEGTPIWAAAEGEVVYVGKDIEGYGNLMIVRHADGWMSSYAHAKEFLLNKGDQVKQGDLLGYVGTTGSVKTPQLHFSLREGKIPIDPESVLNQS